MENDRIVTHFDYAKLVRHTTLPVIAVFKHPDDYPGKWVARVFDVNRPTRLVAIADTHEELLRIMPMQKMVRFNRDPKDQTSIVESWI